MQATKSNRRGISPTALLLLLPLATILALACGGDDSDGDDETTPTPTATSSQPAETSPPADTPSMTPAVTRSPTPVSSPSPTPTPQVDVTPVEPFEVRSTEAINLRTLPSTNGDLIATIFPGETARVTGEAIGEAVEAGDATWYRVEFMSGETTVTGFLYAPYVVRI